MSSFILDTSVAAAWYLPDDISKAAAGWQDELLAQKITLVVPSLHYWELANVLRTYVKRGELSEDLATQIYALHQEAPLTLAEPARDTVLDIALRYEASTYDAVFIALSIERDVPLVTSEKTTTPWVVKLGSNAISLRGSSRRR